MTSAHIQTYLTSNISHCAGSFLLLVTFALFIPHVWAKNWQVATEGSYEIDDFGGMNYTLELTLPPGINGLVPHLALTYNSQASQGIAGVGWGLRGLSIITRCPRSFPSEVDAPSTTYQTFSETDGFCIDGKLLIASESPSVLDGEEFTTKLADLSRVVAYPANFALTQGKLGPEKFKVWTKDMQINTYTRHLLADHKDERVVRSWLLTTSEDTFGNQITYNYLTKNATPYLSSITYSSTQIALVYEERLNKHISWRDGARQTFDDRLAKIIISNKYYILKTYSLQYAKPDGMPTASYQDLLVALKECTPEECRKPIVFRWKDIAQQKKPTPAAKNLHDLELRTQHTRAAQQTYLGDFNGDGKQDILRLEAGLHEGHSKIFLSIGDGYFQSHPGPINKTIQSRDLGQYLVSDFDGDGLADVYQYRSQDIYDSIFLTRLSDAGGLAFEIADGLAKSHTSHSPNITRCNDIVCLKFDDFNADGRTDIYRLGTATSREEDALFFADDNMSFHKTRGIGFKVSSNYQQAARDVQSVHTGDFNGDKRVDILLLQSYQSQVFLVYADGEHQNIRGPDHGMYLSDPNLVRFRLGDFNGDGLTDVYLIRAHKMLGSYCGPVGGFYWAPVARPCPKKQRDIVFISRNDGTFEQVFGIQQGNIKPHDWLFFLSFLDVADMNADGRTDIVQGNHRTFCPAQPDGSITNCQDIPLQSSMTHKRFGRFWASADFNGDGKNDIMYTWARHNVRLSAVGKTTFGYLFLNNLASRPLIVEIENAIGRKQYFEYGYLTNRKWHFTDNERAYPNPITVAPLPIITFSETKNLDDALYYRWGNHRVHRSRYGNMGFAWQQQISTNDKTILQREFSQHYPYIGAVIKETLLYYPDRDNWHAIEQNTFCCQDADGIQLSVKTNVYENITLHSGSVFPYLFFQAESHKDLENYDLWKAGHHFFYDNFGNLHAEYSLKRRGDQRFIKGIGKIFRNDIDTWQIGKPVRVSEMSYDENSRSQFKITNFSYHPGTALPATKTKYPGSYLETTFRYRYDTYGNLIDAVQSANTLIYSPTKGEAVWGKQTRKTSVTYDSKGRFIVAHTNALGHVSRQRIDETWGQVLAVTDANGITSYTRYDAWGNVISSKFPGKPEVFLRHTMICGPEETIDCRPASSKFPNSAYMVEEKSQGSPTKIQYFDSFHRPLGESRQGEDGKTVFQQRSYGTRGIKSMETTSYFQGDEPTVTYFKYDVLSRPIEIRKQKDASSWLVFTYEYTGLQRTQTDPLNIVRTITMDMFGRIVTVQEPHQSLIHYTYHPNGQPISTQDGKGHTTYYRYNPRGQKIEIRDPNIGTWKYRYDGFGQLIETIDAKRQVQRDVFDALGRKTHSINAEGISRWKFDSATHGIGNLAKEISASGHINYYLYDQFGRVVEQGDMRGYSVRTSYDEQGRTAKLTYPRGFELEHIYTPDGKLSAIESPVSAMPDFERGTVEKAYQKTQLHLRTLMENIRSISSHLSIWGNRSRAYKNLVKGYMQDPQSFFRQGGRLQVPALQKTTQAINQRTAELKKQMERMQAAAHYYRQQIARLNHQQRSRLSWRSGYYYGRHTHGLKQIYSRLERYWQQQVVQKESKIAHEIDTLNLVLRSYHHGDWINAASLFLVSMEIGRLRLARTNAQAYREKMQALKDEKQKSIHLSEHLTTILAQHHKGKIRFWQALEYDAHNRVVDEIYGNGIRTYSRFHTALGTMEENSSYDADRNKVRHVSYAFDDVGNLHERMDHVTKRHERFAYDQLNRLNVAATWYSDTKTPSHVGNMSLYQVENFQYDTNGNILYKSGNGYYHYAPARPHHLQKDSRGTYTWDANGYMTQSPSYSITWNASYKPRSVHNLASGKSLEFRYDAAHRKISQFSQGNSRIHYFTRYFQSIKKGGKSEHRNYIYAAGRLIAIYSQTNSQEATTRPGALHYLHWDALGSIDAVSNSRAQIEQKIHHTPFGERIRKNTLSGADEKWTINRGFTGHEHLSELGLIHMKGRLYDPHIGRFLSPDPHIQSPFVTQNFNRYSYALNNPLRYTDPSGYFFKSIGKLFKSAFSLVKKITRSRVFRIVATLAAGYYIGNFAGSIYSKLFAVEKTWIYTKAARTANWLGHLVKNTGKLAGNFTASAVLGMADGKNWHSVLIGIIGSEIGHSIAATAFGKQWNTGRIAIRTAAGGLTALAQGRNPLRGALLSAGASIASASYAKLVGYDTTFASGGDAVLKPGSQIPVKGANNIGKAIVNEADRGIFSEGSALSMTLNHIPGLNATSGLHDQIIRATSSSFGHGTFHIFNIPTLPITAVATFAALSLNSQHLIKY